MTITSEARAAGISAGPSNTSVAAGLPLLDRLQNFLRRYVAYPSDHAALAHTLWVIHAHLMPCWESTPRIAFVSAEPGSGKTRALEVTELLVPSPIHAVNTTSAYLFRKVSDPAGPPTILYDEIDALFGPKAKGDEDIRAMINAGHRRGATAGRCVVRGKVIETEELHAYCAVALAGLGWLPDTIMTRSIVIRMRKRAPGEHVEPFRRRLVEPEATALRDEIATWAAEITDRARDHFPDMPAGVEDRNADVWEALLTIAYLAGAGPHPDMIDWPTAARAAAVELVAATRDNTPTLGVQLLADLRDIFADPDCTALSTETILRSLCGLPEAPWADLGGKPLDARSLARRLGEHGIRSKNTRINGHVVKGYARADLADVWGRYLSELPDQAAPVIDGPAAAVCARCGHPATGSTAGISTCHTCANKEIVR